MKVKLGYNVFHNEIQKKTKKPRTHEINKEINNMNNVEKEKKET
jgi:hypothetical protein